MSTPLEQEKALKNLFNESVPFIVQEYGMYLDLRTEQHSAEYFKLMLDLGVVNRHWRTDMPGFRCHRFLIANAIAPDFVIRHRIFKQMLLSIATNPALWKSVCNIRMITQDLARNRLIARHIFKGTELWKPLLAAQFEVMKLEPINNRQEDPLWGTFLLHITFWEAKHFVFALQNGLMD